MAERRAAGAGQGAAAVDAGQQERALQVRGGVCRQPGGAREGLGHKQNGCGGLCRWFGGSWGCWSGVGE